jgi:membrane-associated phospholipid phosphatase
MRHRRVTALAAVVGLVATALTAVAVTAPTAEAANGAAWPIDTWGIPKDGDNVVLKWNEQLLATIRANPGGTGPTVAARSLGVLNTSMYDAWAAYDAVADPTQSPPGWQRRPEEERTQANKETAISFAAYRTLVDLFPYRRSVYLAALGGDDSLSSTAAVVGDSAAQANITFRHGDGANPTINTKGTEDPYDDTVSYPCAPAGSTCFYSSSRQWNEPIDPWRWQPLCVPLASSGATCGGAVQQPLTPQWSTLIPFGPLNPETHLPYEFDNSPFNPPKLPDASYDPAEIDQALRDTSSLTDAQKVKAEYWADGPGSEFPPGHLASFAQALSRMRQNTLDQDVKLFFALGNALMDASISAWGVKYKEDFWRPITAIRYRYKDKLVNSWLGPGKGYGRVRGQNWQPYQALNVVTPPFPEYVSGHSTFSAAGRTVLLAFFGTDNFNAKVTIKAGSSKIEQGVPAKDVVLSWNTLTAAADEAGMSRRYGGIHFKSGDEHGRSLGKVIGYNDWIKAQTYFDGTASPTL